MRTVACLYALVFAGLVSCESKNKSTPEPSARAASEVATRSRGASAPTGEASSQPPSAKSASAAASASAVPSASAAGPCPSNAKRYDEPRFCVVAGKTLDISYEGGPDEGSVELEGPSGGVLRFTWVPITRLGKESLRAQLERVNQGEELAGSGDLPGGAWSDVKKVGGNEQAKRVVQSVIKTQKLLINCHYTVKDAQAEHARDVCKSVRAY